MTRETRRHFLMLAGLVPFLFVAESVQAADPVCYDPASLPLSQKSRRRALGYVDQSGDPAKRCGLCSFFTATQAGCGTCTMLNGPVAAAALCNSFSAKGGK